MLNFILKPFKKHKGLSWQENFLGGHVTIGRVTIYGCNAMHYAVNIQSKKYGWICFRLPLTCFGMFPPIYWYCSPNGTPSNSTYYTSIFENKYNRDKKKAQALLRKIHFGHNYNKSNFGNWAVSYTHLTLPTICSV